MASLFPNAEGTCRLLDAGAGIGSLSVAFLERWISGGFDFERVDLAAFEIDDSLQAYLAQAFEKYEQEPGFSVSIREEDFVYAAVDSLANVLFAEKLPKYTHAILNPPYKKIGSKSGHRRALRRAGIETVNLYSAFVALAVAQAEVGGQIVAIVPRSFCNGPYYRPFREFVLERAAIRHMHLFEARNKAFSDDQVLQENIIIRLESGGQQGPVTVSTSTDNSFGDVVSHEYPFEQIVLPAGRDRFIHVPTSPAANTLDELQYINRTLADLRIKVSTGPVVDFRVKEHLRSMPGTESVPLLYPGHFRNGGAQWPIEGLKKPNAIERNMETEKWLYPNGFYCVVRRFSSKEEKRRIVASVVEPSVFGEAELLGFENHLNVFHENKRGLPEALAHGLALFLNSTMVDQHFRRFSGHTQVNATDLKAMKYPDRDTLMELGTWAMQQAELTQDQIDGKLMDPSP
jgi:adenine-specific DNA-methyltransferase